MKHRFKIILSNIHGKDLTSNSVFGTKEFRTETVSGNIDPQWRYRQQFEYEVELRTLYNLRESSFVVTLCSTSPLSLKLASISLSLLEVYHVQPKFMLPFPMSRDKKLTSSLTFDLTMELIHSGQIVLEHVDFVPISSLDTLEPTSTYLEYSYSAMHIYQLSRVALCNPMHWDRLDALKIETTHSELMAEQVEIMVKSNHSYLGDKRFTVGTCVIPMKNYLPSATTTEREFRFSERVLSPNGSNVGVMNGTLIIVDVPPALSNYQLMKAQSSSVISYPSKIGFNTLPRKDSKRNQIHTLGTGTGRTLLISKILHKQKSSNNLKENVQINKNNNNNNNNHRHLPEVKARVQTLTASTEGISPPKGSKRETGGSPTQLSPESPPPSVSVSPPPSVSASPPSISVTPAVSSQPSYTYVSSLESHGRPESISISSCRSSVAIDDEAAASSHSMLLKSNSFLRSNSMQSIQHTLKGSARMKRSESTALDRNETTNQSKGGHLTTSKHSLDDRQTTWRTASPPSPLPSPHVMSLSAPPSLAPVDQEFSFPDDATPMFISSDLDAASSDPLNKQGYLTKQGKIVKNWKRRWFKIEQHDQEVLLCYYRYPEDSKPRGRIPLINYLAPDTHTNNRTQRRMCFRLRDSHKIRDYYICADTEAEMVNWMGAIRLHTLHM